MVEREIQSDYKLVRCVDCNRGIHINMAHSIKEVGDGNVACPECYAKRIDTTEYILCSVCQNSVNMRDVLYATEPVDDNGKTYCALPYCRKCYSVTTFDTFKVNELIELRLIGGKTVLFIKGKEFSQCLYLLLNIPTEEANETEDIVNIDEASVKYSTNMENDSSRYDIPPETEFWGHCSNLQAWVENAYHPSILHSNLAVPLLKRLCLDNVKVFHSLLYHLDSMWSKYRTEERKRFVYGKYGELINAARIEHNISSTVLQENSLFFKNYIIISNLIYYGKKWRKLVATRKALKRKRIKEREEKKRLSFIRRRNYWERRIYGSDLDNRRWLRKLRDCDVSVVSDVEDYLPYVWSMNHRYWRKLKDSVGRYGHGVLYEAYVSEGIEYVYHLKWIYQFCNGWTGSHNLQRVVARFKDGTLAIRHLVI